MLPQNMTFKSWIAHRTNRSISNELHPPMNWLYNFARRQHPELLWPRHSTQWFRPASISQIHLYSSDVLGGMMLSEEEEKGYSWGTGICRWCRALRDVRRFPDRIYPVNITYIKDNLLGLICRLQCRPTCISRRGLRIVFDGSNKLLTHNI